MMISSVRRWVSEYLSRMVHRAPRRKKWSLQITQGLEQRALLSAFSEFVDPNPAPGNGFGNSIVALSTGNVVVTSPFDDAGGTDAGAVYLFNGATGKLISTLRGSSANDRIGWSPLARDSIIELSNGNYLVCSIGWHNGTAENAGAVTWGSGTAGVNGVVSASNSLVGSHAYDQVGDDGTIALSNGNYVVNSMFWNNGTVGDAGAVTWGSGTTGVKGVVSASNSLVGSQWFDSIGCNGITELSNGNYVVISDYWTSGNGERVGAVTWGSGTAGVKGVVSASNSLVGTQIDDDNDGGVFRVTVLSNGNYVVLNDYTNNGTVQRAGSVTWGSGTAGVKGVVSASNSLLGSHADDQVGKSGVTVLSNGSYVVRSELWDNGAIVDAGAVTWGSGTTGVKGVVSASNSLVGSHASDQVGAGGITALSNGNYVVISSPWDTGTVTDAGAVTWGSGTTGVKGVVSAFNSLVGSKSYDYVGFGGVTALSNGNYVVNSANWGNETAEYAGAVTWGSGTTGVKGVVSVSNSLVGSRMYDSVGSGGVTALLNGNYVVISSPWDNGTVEDAGAVTCGSGTTGVKGVVSASNSLVGSQANDRVGINGVTALSNGNYVVSSESWGNGTAEGVGAVTWGSGTTGVTGVVSASNSLVGSHANDRVGAGGVTALSNGNYVVNSQSWGNGAVANVGAVTWGSGTDGAKGVVSASNSLVGSQPDDMVGASGVTALTNGNYVVRSVFWNNGSVTDAGAVTWGSGTTGVKGVVSASNSLVGSQANDQVGGAGPGGEGGVVAAPNGSYVVISPAWDNGIAVDAGAVTWGSGKFGVTGVISSASSLVGLTSSTGLSSAILDSANKNFVALFRTERGGKIRIGSYREVKPADVSLTNSQIAENSANGSMIGKLSATDPNVGDTLTFTLVDNAGGRFGISGGNLFVANGSLLNYEVNTSHSVTVRVTDSEGLTSDKVFTVTVLNVNEVPVISAAPQGMSLRETSPNGTTVATVAVDEIDAGDTLTYSFASGNSLGAFAISSAGVITVADQTKLDFEVTPTFTLAVKVSDSLNQTATTTVTVYLIDMVAYTFQAGALRVSGRAAPDTIKVRAVSGLIQIEANGSYLATGLAASTVTSIEVFGGGGSDALTIDTSIGSAVNSYLLGGEGNDTLTGGLGNDTLEGGAGNDQLDGQGGFDTANYALASSGVKVNLASSGVQSTGGAGNDKVLNIEGLIGSAFNDVLTGNSAANQLIGLEGNDTLNGGAGDDSLLGGSGNDYLTGGLGTDSLDGGDNNDTLVIDNFDTSVIGGTGVDKVTVSGATAGVTLNLTSGQIETVQATSSTFNNLFDATGATWAVNITGGAGNDTLIGGNMNDTLNGGAGDDSLLGGSGNDYLTGGLGTDSLDGGDNNDTLVIDNFDTSVIGGAGIDKVTVTGATAGVTLNLTSGEIETVQATSSTFSNTFDATGATWAVNITGGSGDDLLTGGNLNDTLNGGAGDDTLIGNLGNDILTGGIGIDTISYQAASGPVTVNLTTKKTTGVVGTDTLNTIENVIGSLFSDTITGDAFNNLLDGGDLILGNDTIFGSGGTDSIVNA